MSMSLLGFNNAFIRYLPRSLHKEAIMNSGTTLVTGASLIIGAGYLVLLPVLSPKLHLLIQNPLNAGLFLLLCVATSLNSLTDSVFIAARAAQYNLLTYAVLSTVKLALPVLLVSLAASGLFLGQSIAMIAATVCSYVLIRKHLYLRVRLRVDRALVRKMARFSALNYGIAFIGALPTMLLPLLVLQRLGAPQAAYFYIAMMVASLLFAIPSAVTSSLFAEGSHDSTALDEYFRNSVKIMSFILVPAVIAAVALGKPVLYIFGREYAQHAYWPLVWLVLSALFVAVNGLFTTILKVQHRLAEYFVINFVGSIGIIVAAYATVHHGLADVALSWTVGQVAMGAGYGAAYAWRRRLPPRAGTSQSMPIV